MPLHPEDARGVVEFFAEILTDALELAAADTLRGIRLVMDQGARKLRRQGQHRRSLIKDDLSSLKRLYE
ncbi:hypothetical protein D3C78_1842660 [compost metagenome]